jgi:flagellar hook-associated protein 3 FlgL
VSTIFRTTERNIATRTLDNLQLSLQSLADVQNQMSSGKTINKPSDDPTGAVMSMQYRADIQRTTQYSRNSDDALGWLGMADKTIGSVGDSIQQVRDLVLSGATATSDPTARKALAEQIKTIKQTLVGLGNTSYNNRPIFAGTANPQGQTPALDNYDAAGNYNGNNAPVYRTIGNGATVQVNFDGPSIFGAPGASDVFHVLDDIVAHLQSGTAADQSKLTNAYDDGSGGTIASDIDRLDALRLNVQNRQSEVGARYDRVETMQDRAKSQITTLSTGLSNTEDVDIAEVAVTLQLRNTAYQAALSATSKVIQKSLVDFLG